MSYNINKFDGTTVTIVEDGTINGTLDLKLVGKDYPGYGETQNENFVFLLENFAGINPPPRPLNGQLWYDTATQKMRFFDKLGPRWRTTSGADVDIHEPTTIGIGDFWWNTAERKLYVKEVDKFVLVGPQSVIGHNDTLMQSTGVADNTGTIHAIIEAYANGVIQNIISSEEFVLDTLMVIKYNNRFTKIKKGINLANTNINGITTDAMTRFWGTASDSDRFGGRLPDEYIVAGTASFLDNGFQVGNDNDLRVFIENGISPVIENQVSSTLEFRVNYNSNMIVPLRIDGTSILPGITSSINLGNSSTRYNTIYANAFDGIASQSDSLKVGPDYLFGSIGAGNNTIAARDSSGNLTANVFNGVATSARYADLAEKYLSDIEYEVGTVMTIGGVKEITKSSTGNRAIGVISENPAFMMNKDLENGVYVALKGRVPVKVIGTVSKGDRLIASDNGYAIVSSASYDVFAIALETNFSLDVKLIEAVIL